MVLPLILWDNHLLFFDLRISLRLERIIFVYNTNNYFIIALSLLPITMKFRKIVETSIYSSDLEKMKEFYVDKLGLEFVSEQKDRHVFLKTGKNMLLIFNPEVTAVEKETIHGAHSTINDSLRFRNRSGRI